MAVAVWGELRYRWSNVQGTVWYYFWWVGHCWGVGTQRRLLEVGRYHVGRSVKGARDMHRNGTSRWWAGQARGLGERGWSWCSGQTSEVETTPSRLGARRGGGYDTIVIECCTNLGKQRIDDQRSTKTWLMHTRPNGLCTPRGYIKPPCFTQLSWACPTYI